MLMRMVSQTIGVLGRKEWCWGTTHGVDIEVDNTCQIRHRSKKDHSEERGRRRERQSKQRKMRQVRNGERGGKIVCNTVGNEGKTQEAREEEKGI